MSAEQISPCQSQENLNPLDPNFDRPYPNPNLDFLLPLQVRKNLWIAFHTHARASYGESEEFLALWAACPYVKTQALVLTIKLHATSPIEPEELLPSRGAIELGVSNFEDVYDPEKLEAAEVAAKSAPSKSSKRRRRRHKVICAKEFGTTSPLNDENIAEKDHWEKSRRAKSELKEKILVLRQESPGLSQKEEMAALDASLSTYTRAIKELINDHKLVKRRSGPPKKAKVSSQS